jgi:hypothetical protein
MYLISIFIPMLISSQVFIKTGYLQSPFVLEIFGEHFSPSGGINMDPTLMEEVPTGALSMTLSAVSTLLQLNNS